MTDLSVIIGIRHPLSSHVHLSLMFFQNTSLCLLGDAHEAGGKELSACWRSFCEDDPMMMHFLQVSIKCVKHFSPKWAYGTRGIGTQQHDLIPGGWYVSSPKYKGVLIRWVPKRVLIAEKYLLCFFTLF